MVSKASRKAQEFFDSLGWIDEEKAEKTPRDDSHPTKESAWKKSSTHHSV